MSQQNVKYQLKVGAGCRPKLRQRGLGLSTLTWTSVPAVVHRFWSRLDRRLRFRQLRVVVALSPKQWHFGLRWPFDLSCSLQDRSGRCWWPMDLAAPQPRAPSPAAARSAAKERREDRGEGRPKQGRTRLASSIQLVQAACGLWSTCA
eukprot:g11856.t1